MGGRAVASGHKTWKLAEVCLKQEIGQTPRKNVRVAKGRHECPRSRDHGGRLTITSEMRPDVFEPLRRPDGPVRVRPASSGTLPRVSHPLRWRFHRTRRAN